MLACVLWAVTFGSLAWITLLVGIVTLWGAADGAPVGDFVLTYFGIIIGAAGALAALAFAPGVRRLAPASRLLLLGAVACPVPAFYAALIG
ncbi:hypothetical protein BG418_14395 [Streptomyces sp. CBMA152]|nr:hypothetical protein [Streptomyces sp. CBMA152]